MTIRARALTIALACLLLAPGTAVAQDAPPPEPVHDIDPDRGPGPAAMSTAAASQRAIRFPVKGTTSYVDTFGACRDVGCSRSHMGADIFGAKLQHLVAAADGWITLVRSDASGTAGNTLAITDDDGWRYLYLHINNDSPGTDDGRNPARWRFAPGIGLGVKVYAGQHIAYLGDSGNAETTPPHVHFELRRPDGVTINPDASLRAASRAAPDPRLFVFEQLRSGGADDHIRWGSLGGRVIACDLDADGIDEPLQVHAQFFTWIDDVGSPEPRHTVAYGRAGDTPLCGDWDGDGRDTIGVRRGRTFLLRNQNTGGPAHHSFLFGRSGDLPVVGDWEGDGTDTVGVVRSAQWYLASTHSASSPTRTFRYGSPTDVPIVGDWDGDDLDTIGVRRGRYTMVRGSLSGGVAERTMLVGDATDVPVVSHFDPAATDAVSLWRPRPA